MQWEKPILKINPTPFNTAKKQKQAKPGQDSQDSKKALYYLSSMVG